MTTESTPTSGPQRPDAQAQQGTERHRHLRLADQQYVWHEYEHTCGAEDFNKLHHHPPVEHQAFRFDEEGHMIHA